MPTCTKQVVGEWDSAALVRGKDRFENFARTPPTAVDMAPESVEFHERATTAVREVLFKDAEKVRHTL
jgi:hypothetical protein